MKDYNVIGLMSGTSLDGVDIVYVNFKLDKYWKYEIINSKTYKYKKKWNVLLKDISQKKIHLIEKINIDYTRLLSKYIMDFINEFSIEDIDFISSHGHTALHQPSNSLTYQIGNLPILAKYINQKVVCDFRVQDVKLGGQGAPLVPVGEEYLFPEYNTLINLGGEGNLRMAQKKAGPIVTDQGNLILDLTFRNGIDQPELLESQINNIPGVLENGLFVNLTDEVLVGKVESDVVGVESLKKI